MKFTNIILTLIFILFAVFQFNDPDPYLWSLWYFVIAIISGMAIRKKYNKPFIMFCIFLGIVWTATIVPRFLEWINLGMPSIVGKMKATEPHIEFTREFLGLAISIFVLIFHYSKANKKAIY